MNIRLVSKYWGNLIWIEAGALLPSVLVALLYGETTAALSLLATAGLCGMAGLILFLLFRKESGTMYARESFVVAGGGWVFISLLGALPFVFSGTIPNYINAVFETVSGFTTTGASILTNVEAMPYGLLFWRSFTHWLGGIGVLAFLLAVVRGKKAGGSALNLLRAETTGPQVGKMLPKLQTSMQYTFLIYIGLSLVNLVFLLAGGMPLFDSLCTMFGTAGTGGFGIKADSMASYTPYLQTVTTVFMALFGVNFSLYFLMLHRQFKTVLKDEELRLYVGIMVSFIAFITISLVVSGFGGTGSSLHHAAFTVSSIMTTTGFVTVDYNLWPEFSRSLLLVLMIVGAMAGSTGGGFKVSRVLILFKSMGIGLHRLLHPRSVRTVRLNSKPLDFEVIKTTRMFLSVYCLIAVLSFVLISIDGLSMETNLSAMLSCFNNVGPGLGAVGPVENYSVYSPFSIVVLTLNMLLGRLEIFPILLLFSPTTWRRKA